MAEKYENQEYAIATEPMVQSFVSCLDDQESAPKRTSQPQQSGNNCAPDAEGSVPH